MDRRFRVKQFQILNILSIHVNFPSMRVKNFFHLISICLALATGGCINSAPQPAASTAGATPRVLYERNCAVCHGPQGQGTQLGTMKIPPLISGAALTDT